MQIRIQLITLMRTRIQLITLMRIRIRNTLDVHTCTERYYRYIHFIKINLCTVRYPNTKAADHHVLDS